jgi:hypothetical protein
LVKEDVGAEKERDEHRYNEDGASSHCSYRVDGGRGTWDVGGTDI